jgi:hypothetical protein
MLFAVVRVPLAPPVLNCPAIGDLLVSATPVKRFACYEYHLSKNYRKSPVLNLDR